MTIKYAAIPEPGLSPAGLLEAVRALKQTQEIQTGQRGVTSAGKVNAAVTWSDLVSLGLILPSQVPSK